MKISGFSFARNAQKLYYPVAESIRSILPICDEFIIAVGKGDDDDRTRDEIAAIGDPKVRIIDTEWTDREKLKGRIHSQQTNIALKECTGDWCFYVQADEVVHEKDLPVIERRCRELLDDRDVEGLLFKYRHFWGDYDHYHVSHGWYPFEVRIVRNGLGIESWLTAQSFRRNGEKLHVAPVDAEIYHYGWVRPPRLMYSKQKEFSATHRGKAWAAQNYGPEGSRWDYGSLALLPEFKGRHPAVMQPWLERFDWRDELQYHGKSRWPQKHELLRYRVVTFIEQKLLGGRRLGGYRNYVRLRGK